MTMVEHEAGAYRCHIFVWTTYCWFHTGLAGVNYMRTACVIAVARANEVFEPLMHQVGCSAVGF